ncbi:Protein mrg1 [Dionaea muscipula]
MGSPITGGKDKADSVTKDGGGGSSGAGLPVSKTCLFSEGEKVLAYHGPRIYAAKVLKAEIRKNEWKYFVHYLGWSKNWDEWVIGDRLLKYTEENMEKQRRLNVEKRQGADKTLKSGRSLQTKPKSSSVAADSKADKEDSKNNVAKGKKRKVESVVEKESVSTEKLVKIWIPSILRKQLVDDCEYVTKQDKLVKLPRSPNVDEILKQYLEYRSQKDHMMAMSVVEVLNGLRCYFDKALPLMLLYKKERQQFQEAVVDNISPSTIYGAEHLLRLFVKLPELLGFVNIEEETMTLLQKRLIEFLKFLQRNHSTFFLSSYDSSKVAEGTENGNDD